MSTLETVTSPYARVKAVTVYCGSKSVSDPAYDQAAAELAQLLAANNITLVFGGSNTGTMKVLADTMLENGGRVVGIFTQSIRGEYLHQGLTETVITRDLAERKAEMIRRSDVLIALPGGFGTLDELFDAVAHRKMHHGGHNHPIGLLNLNGYYDKLLDFLAHAQEIGFLRAADATLILSATTPVDLLRKLNAARV